MLFSLGDWKRIKKCRPLPAIRTQSVSETEKQHPQQLPMQSLQPLQQQSSQQQQQLQQQHHQSPSPTKNVTSLGFSAVQVRRRSSFRIRPSIQCAENCQKFLDKQLLVVAIHFRSRSSHFTVISVSFSKSLSNFRSDTNSLLFFIKFEWKISVVVQSPYFLWPFSQRLQEVEKRNSCHLTQNRRFRHWSVPLTRLLKKRICGISRFSARPFVSKR